MGIYQSRNFRVGIYERHLLSTNTEVDGRYTTTEVLGIRIWTLLTKKDEEYIEVTYGIP